MNYSYNVVYILETTVIHNHKAFTKYIFMFILYFITNGITEAYMLTMTIVILLLFGSI